MKIIFEGAFESFEITNIQYELDEKDNPIDIVIRGDEKTLNRISEYSSYGCNIQPLDEYNRLYNNNATHEALFARLSPFIIKNPNVIIYK